MDTYDKGMRPTRRLTRTASVATLLRQPVSANVRTNCSVTTEIIQLLTQGLQAREARRSAAALVDRIRSRTRKVALPRGWTDSVDLIREDRRR